MRHPRMTAALTLALLGTAGDFHAQRGGETPPTPFVDEICPGEYCTYGTWIADRNAIVRVSRQPGARVAFRVAKGERVTALTGLVVTTRPARVQFVRPTDIITDDGRIHIVPGQTLYMLTYVGEGFATVWFNGRLYNGADTQAFYNGVCEVDPNRCSGRIVEQGDTVWWVKVRNASGRVGWTSDSDSFRRAQHEKPFRSF